MLQSRNIYHWICVTFLKKKNVIQLTILHIKIALYFGKWKLSHKY